MPNPFSVHPTAAALQVVTDSATDTETAEVPLLSHACHWLDVWEARSRRAVEGITPPDPVRAALSDWCLHLAEFTRHAIHVGQRGGARTLQMAIRDFPEILHGCEQLACLRGQANAARPFQARTDLMRRLVAGEFSERLRWVLNKDLDPILTELCACADPGRCERLLEIARAILGLTGTAAYGDSSWWRSRHEGATDARPSPPAHPSPDEPPKRAHC